MKKMSYEEVVNAVIAVGEEIASIMCLSDSRCESESSFWADKGSKIIVWGSKEHRHYIEFRTRFHNPVLSIHQGKDFCSVELNRGYRYNGRKNAYGYDDIDKDNVYRPYEFHAWGENGIAMLIDLKARVENATNVASNDFIED